MPARGISTALRSAGRTASLSRERHRARNLLVVAQVAMALVLLVSAGLMIRTFQALRTVDPGFTHAGASPDHAHLHSALVWWLNPQRVTRIQNDIVDKLAAIPGVTSAAFASQMPMEGFDSNWDAIFAEDKTYTGGQIPPLRLFKYVSPGFFHTAGTRMMAGRELTGSMSTASAGRDGLRESRPRVVGLASAALGKRISEFPAHALEGGDRRGRGRPRKRRPG